MRATKDLKSLVANARTSGNVLAAAGLGLTGSEDPYEDNSLLDMTNMSSSNKQLINGQMSFNT
jgi:hypothetical protein